MWASALSCLLYFVCDRGKIWRNQLNGLDIRVSLWYSHKGRKKVNQVRIMAIILVSIFFCLMYAGTDLYHLYSTIPF